MFDNTLTLFNYDATNDVWIKNVIYGVDYGYDDSTNSTTTGEVNAEQMVVLIPSDRSGAITTAEDGEKQYLPRLAYQNETDKSDKITFQSGTDFVYFGNFTGDVSLSDDDYDSGMYDYMNKNYDNVYMVRGCSWYSLIPHFEVVVR